LLGFVPIGKFPILVYPTLIDSTLEAEMIYFDAVSEVSRIIIGCRLREGFTVEDFGSIDRNDLSPAGSHVRIESATEPDFIAQTYSYPLGTF
jgi:hypothetical protein